MRGILLGGVAIAASALPAAAAEYKLTVNRERLINAQNEPQNWLMMNGDYGSTRYSRLTQITRDNVKNLRTRLGHGARRYGGCGSERSGE